MSLFTFIYGRIKPYLGIISILVAVIVIGILINYAYYSVYLPNKADQVFKDVANSSPNGSTVTVFMFHVDWCPHCKKALPEWNMFHTEYHGKLVNGYKVECVELNCTESKDAKVKDMLEKYKIEYFPTIKGVMEDGNGKEMIVDYDAKVSRINLEKFVLSLANENSGL
jgi:thiol-disulfide isomerase/thioredoxin